MVNKSTIPHFSPHIDTIGILTTYCQAFFYLEIEKYL